MTRSLMFSRRLVVITYVAVVATDIAATTITVSNSSLRTGVMARLFRKNLVKKFFTSFSPHIKNFKATKPSSIMIRLCFNPAVTEPSPIFPATSPPKKP